MTTLTLCPTGWRLYEVWDELHWMTEEELYSEDGTRLKQANAAWAEYQNHRAGCPECRKDDNGNV